MTEDMTEEEPTPTAPELLQLEQTERERSVRIETTMETTPDGHRRLVDRFYNKWGEEVRYVPKPEHTPEYWKKRWEEHPEEHPLRPGYYDWEGRLARRTEHAGRPEFYNGQEWRWVSDLGDFEHEATRISMEQAQKLAQQHNLTGPF